MSSHDLHHAFSFKSFISFLISFMCLGLSIGVFSMSLQYLAHYQNYMSTGKQALGKIISKEEIMPIPGHLWQEIAFEYHVDGNQYRSKIRQPLKKSLEYKVGAEVTVYFLQNDKGKVIEPTFESPETLLGNGASSLLIAFIFFGGFMFITKKGVFTR